MNIYVYTCVCVLQKVYTIGEDGKEPFSRYQVANWLN